MKQEQIDYSDIVELGFKIEPQNDEIYFNQYGFQYCIITKKLTNLIYIDYAKETRLCKIIRLDNLKECNIMASLPIYNIEQLTQIIDFFTCKKIKSFDYSQFA